MQWMHRWVDSGRLPGLLVAVMRNDRLAWFETCGYGATSRTGNAVEPDTIYRIYSMTKPITTVAALMLYEEGCFQLDDPVDDVHPGVRRYAGVRKRRRGRVHHHVPLARPITVHDLMIHTSGLTYGFQHEHAVDALYRNARRRVQRQPRDRSPTSTEADRRPAPRLSAGDPLELQRLHRRARPAGRDLVRHAARRLLRRAHTSSPLGMQRHRISRARRPGGSTRVELPAGPMDGGLSLAESARTQAASSSPPSPCRAAAASSPRHRTTSGSCGCSAGAELSKAPGILGPQERRAHDDEPPPRRPCRHGTSRGSRRCRSRGSGSGSGCR